MTLTYSPKSIPSVALMIFLSGIISASVGFASEKPASNLRKMQEVLSTSGYNLSTLFSMLKGRSGKGWVKVVEDPEAAKNHKGFTKFQVILDSSKVKMDKKCKIQAPVLILNVEEIAENQTKVSVDQSSLFYGRTLEQLFTDNEAIFSEPEFSDSKKNIFAFNVVAPESMEFFALSLRLNTNPRDDEDFGTIDLLFNDYTFGLTVYKGDDDSGALFDLGGLNRTKYDNDLPNLEVKCND
ncbi:MAG: hypothetical protein IPK04_11905 [Bdellovibrionales bacterium]|nr:hypothetical protein [Bdellovibrionales bacterium]